MPDGPGSPCYPPGWRGTSRSSSGRTPACSCICFRQFIIERLPIGVVWMHWFWFVCRVDEGELVGGRSVVERTNKQTRKSEESSQVGANGIEMGEE